MYLPRHFTVDDMAHVVSFVDAAQAADLVTFDRGLAATAHFRQVPVALLGAEDGTTTAAHKPGPKRRSRKPLTS